MYRRAARHSQRAGARASPEHHAKPGKQEWAVIAFRCGSSNVGAETIYRRVWLFRDEHTALRKYDSLAPGYAYAGIVLVEAGNLMHCSRSAQSDDPKMNPRAFLPGISRSSW